MTTRVAKPTPENIAAHFEKLRAAKGQTSYDKVKAVARYFGITEKSVHTKLRFWLSGPVYNSYFPANGTGGKPRWKHPPAKELVKILNEEGSKKKAALRLKVSPVTLDKVLGELRIEQVWVQKGE